MRLRAARRMDGIDRTLIRKIFDAAPRGYQSLIVGDACATRDLDLEEGGVLDHRELHRAALRGEDRRVAARHERQVPQHRGAEHVSCFGVR